MSEQGVSLEKRMEHFRKALKYSGSALLLETNEEIDYRVFEDTIFDMISMMYIDSLEWLGEAGYINEEVLVKSLVLREMFLDAESDEHEGAKGVRTSLRWEKVFILSDEIQEDQKRFEKEGRNKEKFSEQKLMDLYMEGYQDTLAHLSNFSDLKNDRDFEYQMFEIVYPRVNAFLGNEIIGRLEGAGKISEEIGDKSYELGERIRSFKGNSLWNVESLKTDPSWKEVFDLSQEIQNKISIV